MKKYITSFLHRGLIVGGFGPIVAGIVFLIISLFEQISLTGAEVFNVILSTYLLAFVHAGASVFNQIKEWTLLKTITIHSITLYFVYIFCYLVNSWIEFSWLGILFFTLIFALTYLVVWSIVYIVIKQTTNAMNKKII
jgi:hypothetical protein